MGSPEDEEGRLSDEGPRHRVRLTRGFWLADTACSQALWLAVMGSHPSYFGKDIQNPVENVSWHNVQSFLRAVKNRPPGVTADLPTEAEWEYACRVGGGTAFSWGDRIEPSQANYDATVSYADGPIGTWMGKTVPVKSYAPNAWGLYQMHGNVWEWCADGQRQYDCVPQVDPRGLKGNGRALRGGSWYDFGRASRAAHRFWRVPDVRFNYIGFRLVLRSVGPDGDAESPPEAAVTRDA